MGTEYQSSLFDQPRPIVALESLAARLASVRASPSTRPAASTTEDEPGNAVGVGSVDISLRVLQVRVKTLSGSTVELDVDPLETVEAVKRRVQVKATLIFIK